MKIIDPETKSVIKTICPFCSFGCEFGVVFDDFGVKGVEYLSDGNTGGRLCPRGSAAGVFLNHPRRLTVPVKSGRAVDWVRIKQELKDILAKPDKVAVCFDRNITEEEHQAILGFCKGAGISHIASTYFEPERFFKVFIKRRKPVGLDQIDRAQQIVVLGDPFNQAPMISKTLINWKLSDRKNRLVVIDSINTHTAGFATDFLKVRAGTEPLLLLGLAREKSGDIDLAGTTGIESSIIDEVSQSFKSAENGLIIVSLAFGHTYDPVLFTEALIRFSKFSGKPVMPLFEFIGFPGNEHFGAVYNLIKKRKIKYLINFGELFPYYYPQVLKGVKGLNVCATSTLKFDGIDGLPAVLNLEKEGTIITTFGPAKLSGEIKPASGTMDVKALLDMMGGVTKKVSGINEPELKIDLKERIGAVVEKSTKKTRGYLLLGEKIAFNFMGFFETPQLKINPVDGEELKVRTGDRVYVQSKNGLAEVVVKLSIDVPCGVVSIPAETPDVRELFDFEIHQELVNFEPTEVKIWKKE